MGDYYNPIDKLTKAQIKEKQGVLGILQDGIMGKQTINQDYLDSTEGLLLPYARNFYGVEILFGRDIDIVDNDGQGVRVRDYPLSMAACFHWKMETISIMMKNGVPIDEQAKTSSHYWLGNSESVIYKTYDGKFGMMRAKVYTELPYNTEWAIGGLGMVAPYKYSPVTEGFSGAYTDVLRKTKHTVFAITHTGHVALMHFPNHSAGQVLDYLNNKQKMKYAVMLDGGHVPAYHNGTKIFNGNLNQANLIMVK